MKPSPAQHAEIQAAVAALRRGECIGLPTETVYGLAADARDPQAVTRIFALKKRPADHPVIVHLPRSARLSEYAASVPEAARKLARAFWPGPLTLILPRAGWVPDIVTGGQKTVGLRMPAHPVAQAVLQAFGGGLAAPSANRFGRISPTRAEHVRAEFGESLPIILDGGDSEVGIESTIVDLSGPTPRILRPGMIGREAIEAVIGPLADADASPAPRVSGALDKHYAPRARLRLLPRDRLGDDGIFRVLVLGEMPGGWEGLSLPAEPVAYAHGLYAALRELDGEDGREIRVETLPEGAAWDALRDRLRRAAAGSGGES
ncbi:L-threonylcarbamoyladenylate synthase [Pseudomarimonas salicorniae]|uniref:Threonylcarbamoyl-AMP synthase n=1 Tax=Pseudomarimonas salicorniae TaxID=2933270 RepID=A0ABT0GE75_9GAMM|nr:L-threonylcarbamoyladenylate synthase [Lysobacter sp. CAU 1642]MCK7592652.1 L-threonylcarbamoyladenylate synthase [Lysobacter sp. CAU 1642]